MKLGCTSAENYTIHTEQKNFYNLLGKNALASIPSLVSLRLPLFLWSIQIEHTNPDSQEHTHYVFYYNSYRCRGLKAQMVKQPLQFFRLSFETRPRTDIFLRVIN